MGSQEVKLNRDGAEIALTLGSEKNREENVFAVRSSLPPKRVSRRGEAALWAIANNSEG